ncbi:MAG: zinc ABC transporter solute-binding protein [Rhodospirillaceae bacterium]|jgi:zinc transport system substrate-binding protein|nr:zinc ABC transporter solute-binding protein [Rhodospirillaceae bacterium]MBT6403915.1 zinc ABC transporter solute-binding protein [Rhodospirillaceae bacterium]MBT6534627.1 zinc ABC transporter solute-binding protein [Rhodospirillaceae bacterium]MBT7361936.1 zinc ABC transporter solute-binding protein [Rhodospirillaceae bacterium]
MYATKRAASICATLLAVLATAPAAQADPEIIASIKPIHSLVAGVMEGDLAPKLVVEGAASPHTYSLRPSGARALGRADLIFWVGHNLEPFLEKPIKSLGTGATVVTLMDAPGVRTLAYREGTTFEGHDHAKDDHADEKHEESDHNDDDHDKHDDHADGDLDGHIWLDPVNAQAMVRAIADALITADPEHAPLYAANAQSMHERIEALSTEIDAILTPVRGQPFFVFHDAYHYMEQRYGLAAAGSITLTPDLSPGAGRIRDIRNKVRELGATCVFTEPQFPTSLVDVVTANTAAKTGLLDPLGTSLLAGPDLYFTLMRNMATAMRACLSRDG